MRGTRWAVVGLVGVLLAVGFGAVIALDGATSGGTPQESLAVTVPPGRLGDEVHYAVFERNASEDPWTPAAGWAFRVVGTSRNPDRANVPHDTLEIHWGIEEGKDPGGDLPLANDSWIAGFEVFPDLSSRQPIQVNIHFNHGPVPAPPTAVRGDYLDQSFAPFFAPCCSRDAVRPFHHMGPISLLLEHQERSYVLGQDLNASRSRLFDRDWVVLEPEAEGFAPTLRVAERATIDGHDALAVRAEDCFALALPVEHMGVQGDWRNDLRARELGGVRFLGGIVPPTADVCFRVDVWVSPDLPYPVLYHERVVINGTETRERIESLALVRSGAQSIPWSTEEAPQALQWFNPLAERQPGHHPSDGSGSTLAYPLSQALANILGDPQLVALREWRSAHPDHVLAGLEYRTEPSRCWRTPLDKEVSPPTGRSPSWTLAFGTPAGSYFVAFTAQPSETAPVINCELGSTQGPTFDSNSLPSKSVTLGAIEGLWRGFEDRSFPDPNFVRWGVDASCRPDPDLMLPLTHCPADALRIGWPMFEEAYLGFLQYEEVQRSCDLSAATCYYRLDMDFLMVGTVTAEFFIRIIWVAGPGPAPLTPYGRDDPPSWSLVAYAASAGSSPPEILVGAGAVTASLVAIAIGLYFLPLLKFYGSALLGAFPGYAKLRKEQLLNHKIRENLLDAIRRDPGISPPELSNLTGVNFSTIVYHLKVLEKNAMVSSLIDGRHKRFFPTDSVDWPKRGQLAALRNDRTKAFYELILGEPGIRQRELHRRMGVSAPAALWHLQRLQAAGLVGRDKEGHKVLYYANPSAPVGGHGPTPGVEVA